MLFLVPAYFGALGSVASGASRVSLPRWVRLFVVALVAVVLIQAVAALFHAGLLVMLIGLRSWLFYVPLILLPQLVFPTARVLFGWIQTLVLVATIPAAIGILEAGLIYTGHAESVYALYGSLAQGVTQEFSVLRLAENLEIRRIPSTFTFVAQYYIFLLTVFPIAVASWMAATTRLSRIVLGLAVIVIGIAA